MNKVTATVLAISLLGNTLAAFWIGNYAVKNGTDELLKKLEGWLPKSLHQYVKADDNEATVTYKPSKHHMNRKTTFAVLPAQANQVVFLGDSITQRNEWAEMLQNSRVINRGIDSDRTYLIRGRLEQITALQPKQIFIMAGINDLRENRPLEAILSDYRGILTKLNEQTPHTKVFVQSVLPVNRTKYRNRVRNERIVALNQELEQLAVKYQAIYVDLYPELLDSSGKELDSAYTYDGLHLSGAGYVQWMNVIKHLIE